MTWRIEFERAAAREVDKLDPDSSQRVLRFLRDRIAPLDDARALGQALKGERFGKLWKYRIGDYRLIVRIEDAERLILVLRVGRRREAYR